MKTHILAFRISFITRKTLQIVLLMLKALLMLTMSNLLLCLLYSLSAICSCIANANPALKWTRAAHSILPILPTGHHQNLKLAVITIYLPLSTKWLNCKMSISLHRANLSNQILPKQKPVNCDKLSVKIEQTWHKRYLYRRDF